MAIVYLDVDDEITTAAARIRTATDLEIVLVLPSGSRIATSRINFRLLAHEAAGRSRRLAIVAPEASTRALAATAGLPAFATVPEYEQARPGAGGDEAAEAGGPAAAGPAAGGGGGPERSDAATVVAAAAVTGAAAGMAAAGAARGAGGGEKAPPTSPAPASPKPPGSTATRPDRAATGSGPRGAVGASTGLAVPAAPAPARRNRWALVLAALLGIALLGGAGAAVGYVVLPTATVSLELVAEPVGPIEFDGTADPTAVAVDPSTATFPATRISIPLAATGTFKATGKRVESSAATGQVRWRNCDPTRSYTIPRGTIVRTPAGVGFATQEAVFLPVAVLDPPQITCRNRTVDVTAQRKGPAGNVAAGTITVVPGSFNDVVVQVTNPKATAGGAREEFPQVTAKDVAAADAALVAQLDEQLAEVAANPTAVPEGATVYPETAQRGEPVPSTPAADLVGQEVPTFEQTLTAEGTVVVADPSPLEAIALARLAAAVPEGMELREGSAAVEIGEGIPVGEAISYPVAARAEAARDVDEDDVRSLVKGLTAEEAEAALEPYGIAVVEVWPDWATTITTIDPRLEVTIVPLPPLDASPAPGTPSLPPGSPEPTPSASPSGEPGSSAAPGATLAP